MNRCNYTILISYSYKCNNNHVIHISTSVITQYQILHFFVLVKDTFQIYHYF